MEREISADELASAAAWLRVDEWWREAEAARAGDPAIERVTFVASDGETKIYEVLYAGGYAHVTLAVGSAAREDAGVRFKTGMNPPEDDRLIRSVTG
jgi:hypothetical protein